MNYTEQQVKDMIAEAVAQTLSALGIDDLEEDFGLNYDELAVGIADNIVRA